MEEYEVFLRNQVLAIVKRWKACNAENMDDLMQEARLAFLIHLREIESLDEILWCGRDILAAIWGYWRSMAIVYAPKNRYKAVISGVYRISIEQEGVPEPCASEADASFAAEYHDFLSTLSMLSLKKESLQVSPKFGTQYSRGFPSKTERRQAI